MKIITVIPISRGIPKEELSYFSAKDIPVGSIVFVPLRAKAIPAVVIFSDDAAKQKFSLRTASFQMKKVTNFKSKNFLSEAFLETVKDLADYYVGSRGSVLYALVPKSLFLHPEKLKLPAADSGKFSRRSEKSVIQGEFEDRIGFYRGLIRELFAKGLSLMVIAPTIEDAERLKNLLSIGIERYTFIFHGSLSGAKLIDVWNKITAESHPVLVVGTGGILSVERKDWGAIALDSENSSYYKSQFRPFVDIRLVAEKLAEKMKIRFIVGAIVLRAETVHRLNQDELFPAAPLKWRFLKKPRELIVDMRKYKAEPRKPFPILSPELLDLVGQSREANDNLFIFTARRGLASSTVCSDCGEVLKCKRCGAPLVLHGNPSENGHVNRLTNFFLCHRCGARESAGVRCRHCDSWKLLPLGVGSERVASDLEMAFPDLKLFKVDSDLAPSPKLASKLVSDFEKTPGAVLVGTELALSRLKRPIANAAVASIDSLLAIPDFRVNEKIFSHLISIRSLAEKSFLVQTRNPDYSVINQAMAGNVSEFVKEELERRKTFGYPPFTLPIKVSVPVKPKEVDSKTAELEKIFTDYQPEVFLSIGAETKDRKRIVALITLPPGRWIDQKLLQILRDLPPEFATEVNPENLL